MIRPPRRTMRPCPSRRVRLSFPVFPLTERKLSTSGSGIWSSFPVKQRLSARLSPGRSSLSMPNLHIVDRRRSTEAVPLAVRAPDLTADLGLFARLDPFRDRLHAEVAGHIQERGQEALPLRVVGLVDVGDEEPVELEVVRRGVRELEQARLARAEVVVGEADVALREKG